MGSALTLSYEGIELERVEGVEPSSEAWEASVLPLNYTRRYSVGSDPTGLDIEDLKPGEPGTLKAHDAAQG